MFKALKFLIIGIVILVVGAGIYYSASYVSGSAMTLDGPYHLAPKHITEKSFNVSLFGRNFNVKMKGPINATGPFVLFIVASNYTNHLESLLYQNFTLRAIENLSFSIPEVIGGITVDPVPGDIFSTVSYSISGPISSGEYNVLLINPSHNTNNVTMNVVIDY